MRIFLDKIVRIIASIGLLYLTAFITGLIYQAFGSTGYDMTLKAVDWYIFLLCLVAVLFLVYILDNKSYCITVGSKMREKTWRKIRRVLFYISYIVAVLYYALLAFSCMELYSSSSSILDIYATGAGLLLFPYFALLEKYDLKGFKVFLLWVVCPSLLFTAAYAISIFSSLISSCLCLVVSFVSFFFIKPLSPEVIYVSDYDEKDYRKQKTSYSKPKATTQKTNYVAPTSTKSYSTSAASKPSYSTSSSYSSSSTKPITKENISTVADNAIKSVSEHYFASLLGNVLVTMSYTTFSEKITYTVKAYSLNLQIHNDNECNEFKKFYDESLNQVKSQLTNYTLNHKYTAEILFQKN